MSPAASRRARPPVWLLDLDNTLHDASAGVFPCINRQMTAYIAQRLALDDRAAYQLREHYWHRYGATLQGLVRHHGIDPHHFLHTTHPLSELGPLLRRTPGLGPMLRRLPGRKVLLSNSPRHYARHALQYLGIPCLIRGAYTLERLRFIPKPALSAFRQVLRELRVAAADCILVEDSLDNLRAAKKLGMRTVWVSTDYRRPACVDVRIPHILDLSRLATRL